MCGICGCSQGQGAVLEPVTQAEQAQHLHFGALSAGMSLPGVGQERAIKMEADILGANDRLAAGNRAHFQNHGIVAYNLVSSPGSGKTTLLCATLQALRARWPQLELGVIEGDQQTSNDATRIRATGVAAVQVNTGKGCHLDARMVGQAFGRLPMHRHAHDQGHAPRQGAEHLSDPKALLLIENVGNLVCPAMWDLGEWAKVAILSVTEGEDKPVKYPDMFAAARLLVLNKIDLLAHLAFDVRRCIEYARQVNPDIEVIQLSALSGEGMEPWLDWLLRPFAPQEKQVTAEQRVVPEEKSQELARLRARVAELEAQLAGGR